MLDKELKLAFALIALAAAAAPASAAPLVSLVEWDFNIDGTVYRPPGLATYTPPAPGELPPTIDVSTFQFSTSPTSGGGLGAIIITLNTVGSHSVDIFLDHEIDETINSYTNEVGATSGSPATGQSWEIDEPGYGSSQIGTGGTPYTGDIFDNFTSSALDNKSFYDANDNQSLNSPDDVSMALGWDFTLAVNEIATLRFIVSEAAPGSGFYLSQSDPDSNITLYFYSTLNIQGPGPDIPEPATSLLLSIGLAGLAGRRYWPSKAC